MADLVTYVHNAWYVAAWSHELSADRLFPVRILNEALVIWRDAEGTLTAFADRCLHRLAPLSLGRCKGPTLRCGYHGWLYDRSGYVIEIPGQDRVPSRMGVRVYPVTEQYGWVWIWMGDPSAAQEDLIPPLIGLNEHPEYLFGHGHLDYAAEARLINDNLLDLSHVSFLHAESFQMSDTWARERPQVITQERSIRTERWFRNEGINGALQFEQRVDTYFSQGFYVPGVLLMTASVYPVGTADAPNWRKPTGLNPEVESFSSQAVTPLTDKTARYFYIVGGKRRGNVTVYDMTTYDKGFAEDKTMIEAQQRNIDANPGSRFLGSTADRGVILFNRLVEKLARRESPEAPTADASPAPSHQ